jgi:NTE family protein
MASLPKKIGLALGGGVAKGAAHIGVIKVLETKGYEITHIAGSSIGAFIGAVYAQSKDISKLEELFLEKTNWATGLKLLDLTLSGGLFKGNRLKKFIDKTLGQADFKDLLIPFSALATDINTGEEVRLSRGDLAGAVRASLAIPPLIRPIRFQNKVLTDGGLSNPLPAKIVREMGAAKVIAVNLFSGKFEPLEEHPKLDLISARSLNIMTYQLSQEQLKYADLVIEPNVKSEKLMSLDDFFKKGKIKKFIKAGEKAALEALK